MPRFTTGHSFDDIDNFIFYYFFFFATFFLAAAFLVAKVIPPFRLDLVWPESTTRVLVYFLLQNCQYKTLFYRLTFFRIYEQNL
jgi:hypothetical protein